MTWEKLINIEQLDDKPQVIKTANKQLAVFKVGESCYAIDNRCPHEGYPLAEGSVDDNCVLTCNWHNWKFRLDDGECVLGGDHVRSYAVEVRNGSVFADLSDPPIEEIERQIIRGLKGGFDDRDFGRICREISRLKFSGIDPHVAVKNAIVWSHDRLEFGMTHAYAAAADWLQLAESYDDWERQLICIAEPVDHMSFDALRHKVYEYASAIDEPFSANAFLDAVESEERDRAEGFIARAIADGMHWQDLEPAFATASLAHFQDFGHSAIYVYKAGQLIAHLGEDVEKPIMLALVRSLCYATREDLIPEFSEYAPVLQSVSSCEPKSNEPASSSELHPDDLFRASIRSALSWTQAAIRNHPAEQIAEVMLEVLCRSQVCYEEAFDEAYDRPVSQNASYLWFSHGITFANAARKLAAKFPELWNQALLQMACFIGRNRGFLKIEPDEAIRHSASKDELEDVFRDAVLDHGYRDPIFSAHIVKTPMAILEEYETASESCRTQLLAAMNRLLNASFKQKHVRRLARQAIDLVKRDYPS